MIRKFIALAVVLAVGLSGAAWAGSNPPGNNGTVKIDDEPFDSGPDNDPHVGCFFQVDFSGFDKGDLWADVRFDAHPPTGTAMLLTDHVFIGEDAAGGASDLDALV